MSSEIWLNLYKLLYVYIRKNKVLLCSLVGYRDAVTLFNIQITFSQIIFPVIKYQLVSNPVYPSLARKYECICAENSDQKGSSGRADSTALWFHTPVKRTNLSLNLLICLSRSILSCFTCTFSLFLKVILFLMVLM